MRERYFNAIVCKLWSSAPIDKGAGVVTNIFKGVASRKLADYAVELYLDGELDAVINLINRCHYSEHSRGIDKCSDSSCSTRQEPSIFSVKFC